MKQVWQIFIAVISVLLCCLSVSAQNYRWHQSYDSSRSLHQRFAPPEGYERIPQDSGSFGAWLRGLPLKDPGANVYLFNGQLKDNQEAQAAVIDIDIGRADLQQCADAVIRLRSEYLFACGLTDSISYQFTSGDEMAFRTWVAGSRPVVEGNQVSWAETGRTDSSYLSFREYLDTVFMYAGTASLSSRLHSKSDICAVEPGNLFMIPGFPGHTVMVVDVAENVETGERLFLLAQGFMPAQNLHVLKNPMDQKLSPWYSCDFEGWLVTPEYTFDRDDFVEF